MPKGQEMISISELDFGYSDAESYRHGADKERFNRLFVRTSAIEKLYDSKIFFLLGEKGTGKAAHALYLTNNPKKNTYSILNYIRETDYQKFIALKKKEHLAITDYTSIWKVIIYLLLSQKISREEKDNILSLKFRNLKQAMDQYYAYAFSPEIIYAINFAEESKITAELISQFAKVGGSDSAGISFAESRFQVNLMYIQRKFEEALDSLKLANNHILFIDGVDIRPPSIVYEDYIECLKGLSNAIWSVNNDFFSKITNSQGKLRVVLLLRPDIFQAVGLQKQNTKLRDNSVLLDWQMTYSEYRTSEFFKIADRLLSSQQNPNLELGNAWDYYFPHQNFTQSGQDKSSFVRFLELSMYRPRDIVTMFKFVQDAYSENQGDFSKVFQDPRFLKQFSEYLLGEVRDQLSLYISNNDYDSFLAFFEYLEGKSKFTYDEYLKAYSRFDRFLNKNKPTNPMFFETPDIFLQLLYGLNIIAYEERAENNDLKIRKCFAERSLANISPKVRTHAHYLIHPGIEKALRLDKPFKK